MLDIMAGGDVQVTEVDGLVGEDKGHGASAGDYPHGHAGYDGVPWPSPSQGVDGVDDSKQPIHADAGDEEHGAVHVPVKAGGDHTAHEGAEEPVIAFKVVGDLEGEH